MSSGTVHLHPPGLEIHPIQPGGNETFPNRFPQAKARLSKDNLETSFAGVNRLWLFSVFSASQSLGKR
jgi:hypothetical protein